MTGGPRLVSVESTTCTRRAHEEAGRRAAAAAGAVTYHEGAGGQVGAGHDDDDETKGKDEGAHHFDQARGVVLEPGRGLNDNVAGAGKGQQGAGHERREDDLVDAHLGLVGAGARGNLEALLGCVGIVHDLQRDGHDLVEILLVRAAGKRNGREDVQQSDGRRRQADEQLGSTGVAEDGDTRRWRRGSGKGRRAWGVWDYTLPYGTMSSGR